MTESEKRRARTRPPEELQAYGLVLRGWELTLTWRRAETLHARRLFARDPLDARGFAELYREHHDTALEAYREALELDPNDADILVEKADALTYVGEADRALGLIDRAMALNPFHPDWYLWVLADARFTLGDYEGTLEALARMRDSAETHRMAAAACALLGRMEEARVHACAVKRVQPDFSLVHWREVPSYRDPEPLERFLEGLRRAGLE